MRLIHYFLVFTALALPALAQDKTAVERQFRAWLNAEIWPAARSKGVTRGTFDAAFNGVTLDWDLPDLVPPGAKPEGPRKQRQAEFGAPGKYFNRNSIDGATRVGKQMAARYADTLARIEAQTGVPGRVVLAIWGRESGYGQVPIRHNAFRVLGTKGYMSTRKDYFAEELLALLQIAEKGHAPESAMKSSWAGALGQPQFMPTSFLDYAADGNGDGKADIWRSEADTLASIGNYLARHDWQKGRDWGFEVTVPADISCAMEGPDRRKTIDDWTRMGITRVSGRPFPENERGGLASLLMPAGRNGPAFLVTPNFYTLKAYNNSDLYALFVGHVGDRIQYGVGDFHAGWGRVDGLYRSEIAAAQRRLEGMGKDVGGADGLPGFKTRRSIGEWQVANGRTPTCFPDKSIVSALTR